MTLQEFIKANRTTIDDLIVHCVGEERCIDDNGNFSITDEDREEWVMNVEFLYDMAVKACGLEEVLGVRDES